LRSTRCDRPVPASLFLSTSMRKCALLSSSPSYLSDQTVPQTFAIRNRGSSFLLFGSLFFPVRCFLLNPRLFSLVKGTSRFLHSLVSMVFPAATFFFNFSLFLLSRVLPLTRRLGVHLPMWKPTMLRGPKSEPAVRRGDSCTPILQFVSPRVERAVLAVCPFSLPLLPSSIFLRSLACAC